jgi:MFS family permease
MFIGLIMAFSGIGEAISAPLFGMWTNRIGRVNPPLIASLFVSMAANLIYFFMNSISNSYVLLLSRFLSGVGSGKF